ncbi:MAG: hypothetical protein HC919_01325 [Oscillatoriales cyanobacterium SM2_2_1]|nr:hypothetical protein [Oscillatoriales cyanobacterium SM2_2_1]
MPIGTIILWSLLVIYILGIWRFLAGFKNTNYSQSAIFLAVIWPIAIFANGRYRQNFFKALTGS